MDSQYNLQMNNPYMFHQLNGLQMAAATPVWSVWPHQGSEVPLPFLPPCSIPVVTEPPKKGKRLRQRCKNPNSFSAKYKRLMEVTYGTAEYWSLDSSSHCEDPGNSRSHSGVAANGPDVKGTCTRRGVKRRRCSEAEAPSEVRQENGGQSGMEEADKAAKKSRQMAAMTEATRLSDLENHPVPGSSTEQHECNSVPSLVDQKWCLEDLGFLSDIPQPDGTALPGITMDWPLDLFEGWDLDTYQDPILGSWETSSNNQAAQTANALDVQDAFQFPGHIPNCQVEGCQAISVGPHTRVEQETSKNAVDSEEFSLQRILEELYGHCN
ncbi:uncharacterized protein [Paramormyrops kingsleyae]|uniref:uncharacterized protein isoform X2 n=1 Tax=Paramormyrops kingsleyae TaxID=1676925 RepID=UPI003B97627A